MNIYLVQRTDQTPSWDYWDSFICYAESVSNAMNMHPSKRNPSWDGVEWVLKDRIADDIKVTMIGINNYLTLKERVILSSYNQG